VRRTGSRKDCRIKGGEGRGKRKGKYKKIKQRREF
jgi:hypothetical protein